MGLRSLGSHADGEGFYLNQRLACHGLKVRGVEGLGVDLFGSNWVLKTQAQRFVGFICKGQLPDDPEYRTGRMMPPFTSIPDTQAADLQLYLKNLAAKK